MEFVKTLSIELRKLSSHCATRYEITRGTIDADRANVGILRRTVGALPVSLFVAKKRCRTAARTAQPAMIPKLNAETIVTTSVMGTVAPLNICLP